jgi:ADP-heptose:LPS heptosyltransferase
MDRGHLLRTNHRLGEPLPRRVLVLRALGLGDLLCAVPAFRALRAALPGAEVVLLGLPWARTLVERYPDYLSGFREFPGWPGLPERVPEVEHAAAFLAALQHERFDLAVQLQGSGLVTNPLAALFGARRLAGFFTPGAYCPDRERFLPYPNRGREARRLLALLDHLGIEPGGDDLEFPLCRRDYESLLAAAGDGLGRGDYVCVHPGASVPERRWPAARFAEVARALAGRGLRVVLTGTAAEAGLAGEVARRAAAPCLNLAGRTDLGALGALLGGARLLVCNDTGVSHLAAALRVPSVVVSTGDNPERWAPADGRLHRVLCDPAGVSAAEVVAEAEARLGGRGRRRAGAVCVGGLA